MGEGGGLQDAKGKGRGVAYAQPQHALQDSWSVGAELGPRTCP